MKQSQSIRAGQEGGATRATLTAILGVIAALVATGVFAADAGAFVYWTAHPGDTDLDGAGVSRASNGGGDIDFDFITGANGACGVTVTGTHLYWANEEGGTIGRANLNGTGVNQSFITGANDPCGVAATGAHIYWANTSGGTIGRANLNGTGVNQSLIAGASGPNDVEVDGAHVYWTNPRIGAIGRANLDGTEPTQSFITGLDDPWGVAVNGSHIFWPEIFSNPPTGTIGRANLDGSGVDPNFITGVAGFPCGVAVHGSHVYWSSYFGDGIGRANVNGTNVQHGLIGLGNVACGLAVDSLFKFPDFEVPVAINKFDFFKLRKNQRRGIAKLIVEVPGPGEVELAKTRKVKPVTKLAEAAGKVKLAIRPRGRAKRKLKDGGKAKVKAKVTFTPEGGEPNTEIKAFKLVKK